MKAIKWLLLALPLALAGCSSGDDAGSADSAAPEVRGVTDTEIVIGSYTDLSGPIAIWGVGGTNGARLRLTKPMRQAGCMDG